MKEEDSWDDLLTGNKRSLFCPDLFPNGESVTEDTKKKQEEEDTKIWLLQSTPKIEANTEQLMKRKAEKNLVGWPPHYEHLQEFVIARMLHIIILTIRDRKEME